MSAPAYKIIDHTYDTVVVGAGAVDGARPLNTCTKVVKAFGAVSTFATPKGELSAEDLQSCNAAA